ncbi:LytR C-terminal domain-containing protein [Ornithinimicrobium cryptoxanthini]|uniref:LytR C-terminal domain-containing protein n=1 Tax=Ornithinimicrobium cryptoxanthini TaxID=2934161 RepID=A0ABY4YHG4_9MICO|nr:LytR C-terminal domain-containing protein [Ornithinimicrobium cryptoxanthini]USQ75975.1 LytR C-terminal domain-containing protein [Ornithinimicrobium cryptoxanthini]
MGYVRTAGMSTAARRRRRRTALVLTALIGIVAAVGLYATAYYMGWLGDSDTTTADETAITTAAPTLAPEEVTVNVYNASGAPGIAGRTSQALSSHGFKIDAVDDAPPGTEVPAVAEIRHGAANLEAAQLLQTLVPDATLVADTRQIDVLDLYIGTDFVEVTSADNDSATATG